MFNETLRRATAAAVMAAAASIAVVAGVAGSQAGPGYLAVTGWSANALSPNTVVVSATSSGTIPRRADAFITGNAITGLAWADLDTATALVATIHPSLGRDSHQRKDGWHLHTVQLGGGATAPNDFCLVAVRSTPEAGIAIRGATFTARLRASDLPVAGNRPIAIGDFDAAVGFTVHPDAACASDLGVRIRT